MRRQRWGRRTRGEILREAWAQWGGSGGIKLSIWQFDSVRPTDSTTVQTRAPIPLYGPTAPRTCALTASEDGPVSSNGEPPAPRWNCAVPGKGPRSTSSAPPARGGGFDFVIQRRGSSREAPGAGGFQRVPRRPDMCDLVLFCSAKRFPVPWCAQLQEPCSRRVPIAGGKPNRTRRHCPPPRLRGCTRTVPASFSDDPDSWFADYRPAATAVAVLAMHICGGACCAGKYRSAQDFTSAGA